MFGRTVVAGVRLSLIRRIGARKYLFEEVNQRDPFRDIRPQFAMRRSDHILGAQPESRADTGGFLPAFLILLAISLAAVVLAPLAAALALRFQLQ